MGAQIELAGAMNHFCTYCDCGYAARLLCLHASMLAQREPFRLFVLCFDAETASAVAAVREPSLIAVSLGDVLRADPEYAAIRAQRTTVEFFFTATPVFVRHCLTREPSAERMTYLDADLFFYCGPSAVLAEQGDASIGIVPHRFPTRLAARLKYGTYNVAWVSFRRDQPGLACLDWWRARCLEWCHDYLDRGRFADQGYLDEFPRRFDGVRVLAHPGINAAPWNLDGVRVSSREGNLFLNDQPLLFFHFQGMRELLPGWFEPGFRAYETTLTPELRDLIYLPYLKILVATQRRLQREHGLAGRLGYQRLTVGKSWADRWERFKSRWFLPRYRRFCGELLHVAESDEPA